MAVVAGILVLSQSAQEQRRQAEVLQRQLSVGLTSYEPMYNLQRRLQQAASSQEVESALVVDQRGLVLAASNNALVGLPLPHVLQLPNQHHLRELFADCPSASTLLTCLTREDLVFHGPLPWIGGDALLTMRQYPLALEGVDRYGDRASLITITDVRQSGNEAILFVLKLFLAGLLPLFVGCAGLMVQLRRELIPQLLHLAQIDALSGIYNRRAFTEAATDVLKRARQAGLPVSLALIDVDHFKQINDSYGHDAGDKVIRQVAELLRAALRVSDLVGRLGGDEFAILMQLPAHEAAQALERTRQKIQVTPIASGDGQDVQVDLSVGLATSNGRAGYGLSELMGAADAALYVAKDRGRGQVVNLETDSRATRSRHSAELGYWQVGGF
jgi:diguanylate cyclase (GGDEF)-like protein